MLQNTIKSCGVCYNCVLVPKLRLGNEVTSLRGDHAFTQRSALQKTVRHTEIPKTCLGTKKKP